MRDSADNKTGELDVGRQRRGRGRPPKADAMTGAERQAAYRARHGLVPMTVLLPAELVAAVNEFMRFKDLTKTQVFEKLIRAQLLRKR